MQTWDEVSLITCVLRHAGGGRPERRQGRERVGRDEARGTHKDTRTDTDAGKELGGVQPGWRFVFRGAEAITLFRGEGEWRALLEAERGNSAG